ncbi:hypothetical protein [Turneriella parva]|uniref:Uncharacterized protein n=1 Tax=Turneriella parva (strain ATCC BAA-1111 / DSM 21527 / NCTC 11395 / H) TaxID=869212 RepID=I4B1A0_TURPD|nr:hypothetical protein [Turneriella parva]AFM11057.1 hypothetical protein Turpa_0401 [Turneriella parva DSM 21527]
MAFAQKLTRSGAFYIVRDGDPLVARRVRKLPMRGLFRILFPLSIIRIHRPATDAKVSILPDAAGWLVLAIAAGGVAVEFLMPRNKFPREYPAIFPFAFAAAYLFNLLLDLYLTHKAIKNL